MNRHLLSLTLPALAAVSLSAFAAVPRGYYDSLEGLYGVELKKAVKELIYQHTVIHYGEAVEGNAFAEAEIGTWTVFAESDVRTVDDHLCWWDMYSANNLWVADGHPGLQIEHSVANSWWGGESGSKEAYNDLHHLNPANGDANNQKSNWPLGEIAGNPYWTNDVTTIGTPKSGMGDGATRVFQPHPYYRGDFARAYFYIFTIYDEIPWKEESSWMYEVASDLMLKPWASDMLLSWAAADPVSWKEADRNEAVYKYQNNRNPFIDCPQLAEHIWGARKDQPFHYSLYTPRFEDIEYPGYDQTFAEMNKGQWVPVSSGDELQEDCDFWVITPNKNRAMTYTLISTGKAIDECSTGPLKELKTYPDVITGMPQEAAVVRLEKDGDHWYVGVYDPEDNFMGYINVKTKNNAIFSQSKEETCKAKISIDSEKGTTLIVYTLGDGDYTLQYNSGNPRFAAYSSNQNPLKLYRTSDTLLEDPEIPEEENGVGATWTDDAEEVIAIYDINGRLVSTRSTSGLEKGIYVVVSNFGTKKIRK